MSYKEKTKQWGNFFFFVSARTSLGPLVLLCPCQAPRNHGRTSVMPKNRVCTQTISLNLSGYFSNSLFTYVWESGNMLEQLIFSFEEHNIAGKHPRL